MTTKYFPVFQLCTDLRCSSHFPSITHTHTFPQQGPKRRRRPLLAQHDRHAWCGDLAEGLHPVLGDRSLGEVGEAGPPGGGFMGVPPHGRFLQMDVFGGTLDACEILQLKTVVDPFLAFQPSFW